MIPSTAPYSYNPLLFQQCLKKARFPLQIVPASSVTCKSQAKALSTLIDFNGKPIPAQPRHSLNTCTQTVSISPTTYPVYDKGWSDCGEDLLASLVDSDAVDPLTRVAQGVSGDTWSLCHPAPWTLRAKDPKWMGIQFRCSKKEHFSWFRLQNNFLVSTNNFPTQKNIEREKHQGQIA